MLAQRRMWSMIDRAASGFPLLIEPQFLTLVECGHLRRAMDRGEPEPAEIVGDTIVTRKTIRQTTSIDVEVAVRGWFEPRLDGLRPVIARALGCPLGEREGTSFLRYPAGGFYMPHQDRGRVAGWPAAARRSASVVVFLNDSKAVDRDGDFEGGTLCLYFEPGAPGVEVHPEAGLLVAFPSGTLHEVLPVRQGTRDAAVDWFYDA